MNAPYELHRLVKSVTTDLCDPVESAELAKAIIKSTDIWTSQAQDEGHQDLLVAIASLAAEVLAASHSSVSKEALSNLSAASKLILTFISNNLKTQENVRKFSLPLNALCTGSPSLHLKEKNKLIEVIQNATSFPNGFVLEKPATSTSERPPKPPLPMAIQMQAAEIGEGGHDNRPQTDLTSSLLQQLKSPLEAKNEASSSVDDDLHSFTNKNILHLRTMDASDQLIKICLNLPELGKFVQQWEKAINGEEIPSTETKDQALASLLDDVEIAWKILSLPILEPLTTDRLNDTTKIVMACLVASVSVASMPIQTDEMESISVEIVENSLELFNTILSTIRQSTRAGGHILQNYIMMGAWVLTSGLLVQLASASAVDISASKRLNLNDLLSHGLNLNKIQERFNVLSVALASEALTLSSLLVEDLSTEIVEAQTTTTTTNSEAATLDLFQTFKASQRVDLILNSVPLVPLLFNVAFISFKKGLMSTSRSQQNQNEMSTESMSAKETDDDDDDSEPLLGRWFEETLSLFPNDDKKAKKAAKPSSDRTTSNLLSKVEPSGFYVSLASHIFIFINKHILSSEAGFLTNYMKNGLSEPQMTVLAEMIQDLEGVEDQHQEFTSVLSTFSHNIIAKGLLTVKMQNR